MAGRMIGAAGGTARRSLPQQASRSLLRSPWGGPTGRSRVPAVTRPAGTADAGALCRDVRRW